LLRYSHLAVILVAVFLPEQEWALPVLAGFHIVLTFFFFYLIFGLLCGLSKSNVNEDIDVHDMIILRMVTLLSLLVLFVSGEMVYIIIAAASAPWLITNIITDIFAVLVKWEILEVTDKE
jgi:p-aminobenzoyl-glutamate transporter AbgT